LRFGLARNTPEWANANWPAVGGKRRRKIRVKEEKERERKEIISLCQGKKKYLSKMREPKREKVLGKKDVQRARR